MNKHGGARKTCLLRMHGKDRSCDNRQLWFEIDNLCWSTSLYCFQSMLDIKLLNGGIATNTI